MFKQPLIGLLVCFGLLGWGLAQAETKRKSLSQLDIQKLALASVSAAVFDTHGGEALYTKNADWQMPIASITKLMTAMVVLDAQLPLSESLTITRDDFDHLKNTFSRLHDGAKLTRREMLKLALMSSENRTAASLARHYPGGVDAFVAAMNVKAKTLSMKQTFFADPTGLSSENLSTAQDLVKLLLAADDYPLIREYTTAANHTVTVRAPSNVLGFYNTNPLVNRDAWEIHISKTGYINEAGRCLVMLARIDDRRVAIVLLDSFGKRSPLGDAGRVRRWLETGASGPVAGDALRYEQERSAKLRPVEVAGSS